MQVSHVRPRPGTDFDAAQRIAKEEAGKFLIEPMILSWRNARTGQRSPNVECCHEEGKEAWEIYAESRGGMVRVEVGDEYAFIFGEGDVSGKGVI